MVVLNLDCWRIVFQQLEPDTRTLYNCLFVSKTFFDLSTRVLYRQPFKVFAGQKRFSFFSTTRLENLLEVCSGFASPTTNRKQNQSSFYSTLSTKIRSITIDPCLFAGYPAIGLPTTINYYKLVSEYPSNVTLHSNNSERKDQLTYFAETIPFLFIDSDCLDIILPMVSRFRSLHTLHIDLPPQANQGPDQAPFQRGVFGPDNIAKIVQFVESHRRLFPGLLKSLNNTFKWIDWQELTTVVKAMGGVEKDSINMARFVSRPEDDLGALVVSRLKELTLECDNTIRGMELKAIEILKQCRVLETLVIKWPNESVLNWSLSEVDVVNGGCDGGIGGQGSQSGLVKKSLSSQKIRLKHLSIRGGTPKIAFAAMMYFRETLESIKIQSDHNTLVEFDTPLGWSRSLMMPKLKRIEVYRMFFFAYNLSCCPNLETLSLSGSETDSRCLGWLKMSLSTKISVNLRTLDLNQSPAREFDLVWLKQLINLEYLCINDDYQGEILDQDRFLIDVSTGWWFPYLRHVALSGKSASSVQGQILWVAPKLEFLALSLGCYRQEGLLDTNTFLLSPLEANLFEPSVIPPDQSDTDGLVEKLDTTTSISSTLISKSSFPSLKSLWLSSFRLPENQTPEAFGDEFFGHRARGDLFLPSASFEKDGQAKSIFRDPKMSPLMFPNLEQLEFLCPQPSGRLYPCVLQAMKSLPKLELIKYHEQGANRTCYDSLAEWLIVVPGDTATLSCQSYRNRPRASVVVEGATRPYHAIRRCAVEFDHPLHVRYQLNPNLPVNENSKKRSTWRQMFSMKKGLQKSTREISKYE